MFVCHLLTLEIFANPLLLYSDTVWLLTWKIGLSKLCTRITLAIKMIRNGVLMALIHHSGTLPD